MYPVFESTLAFLARLIACAKSRKYWEGMARQFLLGLQYQALGAKETLTNLAYSRNNKTELPSKNGNVAIVTGGSRGIGAVIVKMLLECDMNVIIACRRIEFGKDLISVIRMSGIETGTAKVYRLDNSSLASVREFANEVKRDYDKVNVLINNAGVMFPPYEETVDGFEQQWSVNYLSHFLLTALLMPLLRKGGTPESAARVVNVSSCAHLLGEINFNDINYKDPYVAYAAYAQSKLAQVILTKYLDELCKAKKLPIHHYAAHPGVVNTDLFEHSIFNKVPWFKTLFFKTPRQGATTIVYAAVSEELEDQSGVYLSNCRPVDVNPLVTDKNIQEKLVALSLQQTQLSDFLQYL